jgi:hypothetical protein
MMIFSDLKPSSWRNKASERLRRLYNAYLIDRWYPPVDSGAGSSEAHYVLDVCGAKLLAKSLGHDIAKVNYKRRVYVPQTYRHTLKVYDFKAMLHVLNRQLGVIDGGTVGEIMMWKMEHETKLIYHRQTEDGRTVKDWLVPDALCAYKYRANGALKLFFLEADNATEDIETLKAKMRNYIMCYRSGEWQEQKWAKLFQGMFPAVLVLLHDKDRAEQLARYSRNLKSNILFLFATYEDLVECNYKSYGNCHGKTRKVLSSIKVNLLEPIWLNSRNENKIQL